MSINQPPEDTMTTTAISAAALHPGDLITQGTLPNGTVATVEVHNWTVTVGYTDGREHFTSVLAILHIEPIADRLEELRARIDAESISWGEVAELQSLAPFIDPSDYELRSWAGVPEFDELVECVENDTHLVTTDADGYCNVCGQQDPFVEGHAWVHSVPSFTPREECAICNEPRVLHTMEEGEH